MTAAAEALARDEAAVTLARDTHALLRDTGTLIAAVAEWADDQIAGGAPPKWVATRMIIATRLIASATHGRHAALVTR